MSVLCHFIFLGSQDESYVYIAYVYMYTYFMLFAEKLFVCPGVSQSSFVFTLNNKPSLDYGSQCPISHKNHIVCTCKVQNSKCDSPPAHTKLEKFFVSFYCYFSLQRKSAKLCWSPEKNIFRINKFLKYIQLSNIEWILNWTGSILP